ncbi:hypothetical protein AeMF1_002273 [Aphanomyces euteiches]|nr:hypothetical protein AeMF1_002273 [Aphanomyces euteiches]KAH9190972.1 hypothetical protein AeNC1_007045 [Aphanomyces euteiches]
MDKATARRLCSMKKSLERSCIKFVPLSRPVTFHVAIYTTEDDVPTAIWLQRQRSKVEWGCFVRDVANHTPKGAQYVLPSSVVVVSLVKTLKKESNECRVDLRTRRNGDLTLVLTMTAFEGLKASYAFHLARLDTLA